MILVITEEPKIHVWHDVYLSVGLLLRRRHKGGIHLSAFTRGFDHVSDAAFTICGRCPSKVISTDNSPHLTFSFTWPAC